MQDILDAMLQCQSMWMYLEPIFSSEDIIAQMPENGRKFAIVDSYWKNIVAEAVCVIEFFMNCMTVSTANDQQLYLTIIMFNNNKSTRKCPCSNPQF